VSRRHAGWTGRVVAKARVYWASRLYLAASTGTPLPCHRCGGAVLPTDDWDVDHIVGRAEGGRVLDRNNQWPSHSNCNRRDGQRKTTELRAKAKQRLWSW